MNAIVKHEPRTAVRAGLKPPCDVDHIEDTFSRLRLVLSKIRMAPSVAEVRELVASDGFQDAKREIAIALTQATEPQIRATLATLVGAYPNASKSDLTAFGALLVMDVRAMRPTVFAISRAVTNLRRTSKFLPSIAEVIEAVKDAQDYLANIEGMASECPQLVIENLERGLR
jgi:hypothetical protein